MTSSDKATLRDFMRACLASAGDHQDLSDDESLFMSGRLDSLAMTTLIVFLEESFGVDFAVVGFDVERVDSIAAMESLVDMGTVWSA